MMMDTRRDLRISYGNSTRPTVKTMPVKSPLYSATEDEPGNHQVKITTIIIVSSELTGRIIVA